MAKRYLSLITLENANALITSGFQAPGSSERVFITRAVGRISSEPVYAKYSVPEVNLSAMDGIAVRSRETLGASEQTPATLTEYARVNTGNIVPPGYDAVIMIEDTWSHGERMVIRKAAAPWQHIRPAGEDIREGRMIIPGGHTIRAFDVGALATYGITHVNVRTARVGIIPTGSELVPLGSRPAPGQVVESNTVMAEVLLEEMGAHCTRYPIVPDDPDLISKALLRAAGENDLVLISAGSSAGTRDFTADVIRSAGELLFHGVAMKPGKPAMLGRIQGRPVIGLPGYPLAAQTVLRELAMPLLEQWGLSAPSRQCIRARLAQALASDPGFDEFVPVYAARVGTILWASPNSRGAGVQMATVKSNGYVHVPAPLEGYDRGSECSVVLTTDPACIDKTVLLSGVLDPALEELAHCPSEDGLLIHATNTGTLGGFLALRMNACHAAPVSLPAFSLLPQCHFLASHLLPEKHRFVHLASMGQGIASRDGIGPEDLPGARFINTRKDTTSRMILDLLLAEKGIGTDQIDGYTHEVQGSLAVADAIRKGFADAGMCSSGIAESAGLEFVPVAREDYELVLNRSMEEDPLIQALIRRIASPGFREILARKGGYDCTGTGIVRCLSRDLSLCPVADDHIDYIPAGSC